VAALVRRGRTAPDGVEVVQGDLACLPALRELVRGADVVLHLAAVGVQARNRDWATMVDVNVAQPLKLAEAAVEAGAARLVTVGTCLEYYGHGKLPGHLEPRDARCTEEETLEADEPYGAAKAAGGLLIRSRARSLGLSSWYLRFAPIYGPGDDSQKVLPAAVRAARERRPFPMTAGEQVREWLHVSDAVAGILSAAVTPPPDGVDVVNIGTGEGFTLREVVGRIFELAGAPRDLVQAGAVPYRRGEAHRLLMSTEKARRLIPTWTPRVGLDVGLAELVARGG
ncbi:MAG: NAD-dependent epimerase/dehydratase family protein, partial [Anaeromyxobacteraceae bacterium]